MHLLLKLIKSKKLLITQKIVSKTFFLEFQTCIHSIMTREIQPKSSPKNSELSCVQMTAQITLSIKIAQKRNSDERNLEEQHLVFVG